LIYQARRGLFGKHKPADTVVGVETLARAEYLIEFDAIAVTGCSRQHPAPGGHPPALPSNQEEDAH
jgi:hypothetical protein